MKKIIFKTSITIMAILLLSSCAVNRTVDYNDMNINLFKIKNDFALVILDHRIQVTDGSRKPDFVGYMLSGTGIAWPVGTKSGNNYTDDLTASISSSLQKFEVSMTTFKTNWEETEDEVKSKLFNLTNNTKILVVLEELHSDGYGMQKVFYKINVFIYDLDNKLVEYKVFKGNEKAGGTVAFGPGKYKEHLPRVTSDIIESILTDKDILKVINRK